MIQPVIFLLVILIFSFFKGQLGVWLTPSCDKTLTGRHPGKGQHGWVFIGEIKVS